MWKFLTNNHPAGTRLPSPDGHYVAVLGAPQEIWGNYLADFALWEVAALPQLRYYHAGYSAHALDLRQTDQPTFVHWSREDNWLTFYEFKRQETYQIVFIQAAIGQVYRVPATDDLLQQLPLLSQNSQQIAAFLQQASPGGGPLVLGNAPAELHLS